MAGRNGPGYNFLVAQVSANLRVTVLFFGRMRDLTGVIEEALELPAGSTLADAFAHYSVRFPQLGAFRSSLVASRNEEFAPWDTPLADDDTIAFLPPVSGG